MVTMTTRRIVVSFVLLSAVMVVSVSAFVPSRSFGTLQHQAAQQQHQQQQRHLPRMNLAVVDPETAMTALHHFSAVAASSQLLADAAAAVATDAAAAAADVAAGASEVGWWGSYINLFKSALEFVHSSIDAPLRSVGFDQTWGVSIALFTFGTW